MDLKGLNSPIKCSSYLDILARNHIDIAMLQETHLQNYVHKIEKHLYQLAACSSAPNKTKGAIIMIHNKPKQSPSLVKVKVKTKKAESLSLNVSIMEKKLPLLMCILQIHMILSF